MNNEEDKKAYNPVMLIILPGAEELGKKIFYYLENLYSKNRSEIVEISIPRFSTGDAKAMLHQSVRGADVFIVMDVCNYSCKYKMYDMETATSPDEHFQNLKRVISAIGGKANKICVVSPMLYSARQDRKIARESLDCAVALRELENMNVDTIVAFDVHDDRVQNAVPLMGFDKLMPEYQVIKAMAKNHRMLLEDTDQLICVSPDVGAINRNLSYSTDLNIDLGMFYKRRSRNKMADGKYMIEEHKYIGPEVEGMNVIMVDDIIASGETILDAAKRLKALGAKGIYIIATFGLFTNGIDRFEEEYRNGTFNAVYTTNANYRADKIRNAKWYCEVDISKYLAMYIHCINIGESVGRIIDPQVKIHRLLENLENY